MLAIETYEKSDLILYTNLLFYYCVCSRVFYNNIMLNNLEHVILLTLPVFALIFFHLLA